MQIEEVQSRMTGVFRRVFQDPGLELNDAMTASDVAGWDSLNHVALIADVEKEFGVKFKLRELLDIENVGDLIKLVSSRVSAPG